MTTRSNARKKQPAFGPGIVRGWFDAVLNPMIQTLKYEQMRLEEGNWTWQVPPGQLESILPIKKMIQPLAEDTLEQFLNFHPDLKEEIRIYEDTRAQLVVACMRLQRVIENSEELKAIYQRAKGDNSATSSGATISSLLSLPGTDDEHLEALAQCVVNRCGELPRFYIYSPVWNKYRDELLALLKIPHIEHEALTGVDHLGKKLLRIVEGLIKILKEARDDLSLKY
ncbi:MAG: hypothetical protein ACREAM_13125, partial [Blastocatellia bacterium]